MDLKIQYNVEPHPPIYLDPSTGIGGPTGYGTELDIPHWAGFGLTARAIATLKKAETNEQSRVDVYKYSHISSLFIDRLRMRSMARLNKQDVVGGLHTVNNIGDVSLPRWIPNENGEIVT